MTYPITFDSLPAPVDGVSEVVAADILDLAAAVDHTQQAVGLEGDTPSPSGSIFARITRLEGLSGGIAKQTTAPSSPTTNDLWIDTDDTDRPLSIFYSAAWHLIGANALTLQGNDVDATAPTADQVLAWDDGAQAWTPTDPSGGMDNPMSVENDLIYGGTVVSGVAAPTRLGIGSVGQYLGVLAGPTLSWVTPNYIPAPSAPQQGDILYYNGTGWVRLGPGTTGQFLKTLGASSNPAWSNLPSSPPGTAIEAPSGSALGDLLVFDGTDWVNLTPGTSGLFLKSNGTGVLPSWAAPSGGGASLPLTTTGDIIYSSDNSGTAARLAISGTNAANKFLGISGGAPSWKSLGGIVVDTYLDFAYGSAPSTPAASTGRIYAKSSTGKIYFKNAAGTEYDLTSGSGGSAHTIQDEGTSQTQRSNLNFVGTMVAVTDDSGNDATVVTLTPPTTYYQSVRNALNTADMTQRAKFRFTGTALNSITDDSGGNATVINYDSPAVFGASGSGHTTGVVPDPGSSAGSTRFLREDATWAVPSGGGGGSGGSRLSRTTSGLILWHDYSLIPDHDLTTTADAWGYQVRTTYDHGTWKFRNGLLYTTTSDNPGDCSNLSISQLYGIYQARFYTTNVGSIQGGLEWAIQSGADTRQLYIIRNGAAEVYPRTAGSWGSGFSGTAPSSMLQDQWICGKIKWASGANCNLYCNRQALSVNNNISGSSSAGGFGLVSVSGANSKFKDYAIYTSTILTVAGLTSTQAFRLLDAGGNVVASSATQSGGTATIDLATVCDCPFTGSIEVHSSTAFTSLITGGRYPAEGISGDIWGGDTYTYV